MKQSKEMAEAFSRLSQIANEEQTGEDIPNSYITNIEPNNKSETSLYSRIKDFAKNKSLKIDNQKRLKFLEELGC